MDKITIERETLQAALDALDHLGDCSDRDVSPDEWDVAKAEPACDALRAALAAQPVEPTGAEAVCAEAYQVVGHLLDDLGQFDTERGGKILDNLNEARLVHKDVLPWRSFAQPAPAAVPPGYADELLDTIRDIEQHIGQGVASEKFESEQRPGYGTGTYTHISRKLSQMRAMIAAAGDKP